MKFKVSPKVENVLRKGMQKFGGAVESVIGSARQAKEKAKESARQQQSSVSPIIALESQVPIQKIKELITLSIDRAVPSAIPNLIDKSALELCDGPLHFSPLLKEKGSGVTIHADIGVTAGAYPKGSKVRGVHSIRSTAKNIPFENGFFDYVIANLATSNQGDIVKTIKEVSRLVALGGRAVIVDFHPFGPFAKRGPNRLRSVESIIKGVEDYYRICEASSFQIGLIKEAFIDETMRAQFETPEEKSSFRSLKDSPFLIFLYVKKRGR